MLVTTQTLTGLLPRDYGTATVTADPSAGILRIGIGPGGLLQIQETVQLHGDTIQLSPAGMSLHGQPVPARLQDTLTSHLTIHRTLSGLPLNLTPRSLTITTTGLQVALAAGPGTPDRHRFSTHMHHSVSTCTHYSVKGKEEPARHGAARRDEDV